MLFYLGPKAEQFTKPPFLNYKIHQNNFFFNFLSTRLCFVGLSCERKSGRIERTFLTQNLSSMQHPNTIARKSR